jgi:hypothetical protein
MLRIISKPGHSQSPLPLTRLRKVQDYQQGLELNGAHTVLVHPDVNVLGITYRKEKHVNSYRNYKKKLFVRAN